MKPNTPKTTRNQPLQKVKDGFERNRIDYTERKERRCTILEVKRKTRRAGSREP